MGRLHRKKGVEMLLAALAQLEPQRRPPIVVAGTGEDSYVAELKGQAAELGVDANICWTGHVEGTHKWSLLSGAEAMILPSHSENFGVAVAESLACGVPVLISSQVGLAEAVAAAGAGIVAPDTTAGTLELLSRWLGTSSVRRVEMSRQARRLYETEFGPEGAADDLFQLMRKAVAARSATVRRGD
jgi:glycosyltransferase involved in cell wall biosynthesis